MDNKENANCCDEMCQSKEDCFCKVAGVHLVKYGSDNPAFWKQKEPGRQLSVEIEGCSLLIDLDQEILIGDTYIAKRNGPWQILTCRKVYSGCVFSEEISYPFDLHECRKVISID